MSYLARHGGVRMKEDLRRFVCNNCGKKSKIQAMNNTKFPYGSKWIFLYNLEFKVVQDKIIRQIDAHFCCKKCFIKFMEDKLQ
jgi:protein-arginine kinase activator protein McsA